MKQPFKLLTFVSKKNRQQFFLLSILQIQCYNTLLSVNDKPILNQHVKSSLYCRSSVFIVPFTCLLFIGILLPVHAQVGPTSPKLTRLVLVSGTITQKHLRTMLYRQVNRVVPMPLKPLLRRSSSIRC